MDNYELNNSPVSKFQNTNNLRKSSQVKSIQGMDQIKLQNKNPNGKRINHLASLTNLENSGTGA